MNKKLIAALKDARDVLNTARRYFPKSVKNADTFQLLNVLANSVKPAIAEADQSIEVGDWVEVPDPNSGIDSWNHTFVGYLTRIWEDVDFPTKMSTVRDQEDDYFDIEYARLRFHSH